MMTVKITFNDRGTPAGKLADAELHFTAPDHTAYRKQLERLADDGRDDAQIMFAQLYHAAAALAGLKLIGFAIWERKNGPGRNVTFPARQYSVNGERRSFALLRPVAEATAQESIRDLILAAYADFECRAATPSTETTTPLTDLGF